MVKLNRKLQPQSDFYPTLQPVYTPGPFQAPRIKKSAKSNRVQKRLYMGVTAALLFGIVQCARVLVVDVYSLSKLAHSNVSVQQSFAQTHRENQQLSQKIARYSSRSGIEELARNSLNMVSRDEVPVRFQ